MSPVQESLALETAAYALRDHQPSTYAVVREWHNEHHPGAFDYCDLQPCHAVVLTNRRQR